MAIFWFGGLRRRGDSSREIRLGGSEGARECYFAKEALLRFRRSGDTVLSL
jgi:hypothetical protein